ncbi:MAG: hypothetical protein Q9227_002208 [Pyrenula ochraceoflavens]
MSPNPVDILDASQPDTVTYDGSVVLNRTKTDGSYKNVKSSLVTFTNIPWKATGCMLKFTVPKSTSQNQFATVNPDNSGAFQSDIWLVEPDPLNRATWNTPPKKNQLVSTVRFPTQPQDKFETYIWSGVCPYVDPHTHYPYGGVLSFLFEGSDWQQLAGSAKLYNSIGGKSVGDAAVYFPDAIKSRLPAGGAFLGTGRKGETDLQSTSMARCESITGERELVTLARELRARYPELQPHGHAFTTYANLYPRVVQSARIFTQEYAPDGSILVINSTSPKAFGNSLAPSDLCPLYHDSAGAAEVGIWSSIYLPPITAYLNSLIFGNVTFNTMDVSLFPYLCGFESSILGLENGSPFCHTFAETRFRHYEYAQDLRYYYGNGPGSFGNSTFMLPLLRSVASLLVQGPQSLPPPLTVAFLNDGQVSQLVSEIGVFDHVQPLDPNRDMNSTYRASRFVNMRGTVAFERLACGAARYVRLRLNDAVYPVVSCNDGPGKSCEVEEYARLVDKWYRATGGFVANCGNPNAITERDPVTDFWTSGEIEGFISRIQM